jgi:chaperonin GroEL
MEREENILRDVAARNAILAGIDKFADAIRITLGPKGRNVILQGSAFAPVMTNSGAAIAREIEFADAAENAAAHIMQKLVTEVQDRAGDGTAAAVLLTQHIVRESFKNIAAGADPIALRKGILAASETARSAIQEQSKQIKTRADIAYAAAASAGDEATGDLIAGAMEQMHGKGVILVEESDRIETSMEIVEGMRLERGYISPRMVTDEARSEAVLEDAFLLLTDYKLSNPRDILPLLEDVIRADKCLLIIAEEIEGEALSVLLTNKARGTLLTVGIRAPEFAERRKESIRDIAVLTGATVISEDYDLQLSDANVSHLGRADRIVVTKDKTLLVGGKGKRGEIEKKLRELKTRIAGAAHEIDKHKLRERYNRLSGGIAVLKVGTPSETERKEIKQRTEGALAAAQAAVDGGIVPGGGVAFLCAADAVYAAAKGLDGDMRTGALALARALAAPSVQIAENAGMDGSVVRAKILENKTQNFGYDAARGAYGNLRKAGVIDPTNVVIAALECAVSTAAQLILADVTVMPQGVR